MARDYGQWFTFRFPDGGAELAIHTIPPKNEESSRETKIVHEAMAGNVLLANLTDPEGNLLQLYQRAGGV